MCPVQDQKVSLLLKRTDALINPGNNGGPLCNIMNRTGALVGDVSDPADKAGIKTGVIITYVKAGDEPRKPP